VTHFGIIRDDIRYSCESVRLDRFVRGE